MSPAARKEIVDAYKRCGGSKVKLAAALGAARSTLHKWIREDEALARALVRADAQLFEEKLRKARG